MDAVINSGSHSEWSECSMSSLRKNIQRKDFRCLFNFFKIKEAFILTIIVSLHCNNCIYYF